MKLNSIIANGGTWMVKGDLSTQKTIDRVSKWAKEWKIRFSAVQQLSNVHWWAAKNTRPYLSVKDGSALSLGSEEAGEKLSVNDGPTFQLLDAVQGEKDATLYYHCLFPPLPPTSSYAWPLVSGLNWSYGNSWMLECLWTNCERYHWGLLLMCISCLTASFTVRNTK